MRLLLYYAVVVLLMPFATIAFVHEAVGGFATYVGFGAAFACTAIALVLAQTQTIVRGAIRLMRSLTGGRAPDAPPTARERFILTAGPVTAAIFVYAATGAVLSLWAHIDPLQFIGVMVALGAAYGYLMSVGMLGRLDQSSKPLPPMNSRSNDVGGT